jgi:transcriptional regulator with XRE-family HTH domain
MSEKKIRNMEEFAAVSGLSRPTVSKYFNDPDSVRSSTRSRIEEALERYDFRPNIYAVNQNRRLTKNIGIVVPYLADPFFAEHRPQHRDALRRCGVPADPAELPRRQRPGGRQSRQPPLAQTRRRAAGTLGPGSDKSAIERFCATCRPCCSTAISRGWARPSSGRTTSVSSADWWIPVPQRASRRVSSRWPPPTRTPTSGAPPISRR